MQEETSELNNPLPPLPPECQARNVPDDKLSTVTPGRVRTDPDDNNTRDGTTQTRENNMVGSDPNTHNLHPGKPAGDGTSPNTANTAVFLCDSNGKFLNTKTMFPSSYATQYFRCPKIENARALIQNKIIDSPQLIVIHTGTNDLEMTHSG